MFRDREMRSQILLQIDAGCQASRGSWPRSESKNPKSNYENRYNIIMAFQTAKTDITYPSHAARIHMGVASLPNNSRAAQGAGVMTKHLPSARMLRQLTPT